MPINWEISNEDYDLLMQVVDRVRRELKDYPDETHTLIMDLEACHANGCPLDFAGLLKAPLLDFSHDIDGIRKAIDRSTGKLTKDCFMPRYALANRLLAPDRDTRIEDVLVVRAIYPRATAMSDHTLESAWSEVRADHDEDGLAVGDCLASGRTQEEAWKNAADELRKTNPVANRAEEEQNKAWDQRWSPTHDGFGIRDEDAIALEEAEAERVEYIDITPRGLTTPEGQLRVAKTKTEFENATAEVANAAEQFFNEHRYTLLDSANGTIILRQPREALREDLHQLDALIGARRRKQEEFLRAVAGAPAAQ